jgi:hypothetical protein
MARISTYPLDESIQGTDKWIGSDSVTKNATKNFTAEKVAQYLNSSGVIESQTLRYMYQDKYGQEPRLMGTISFNPVRGEVVSFSTIDSFMLSAYAKPNKDVQSFYIEPLIGSTVLITNANNVSNWAVYVWNNAEQDIAEPLFYNISLTFVSGSGAIVDREDYLISLLGSGESVDKTFIYTQSSASSVWNITHNLNKYPSVSVVDTANTVVYGDVNYINENELTITFTNTFSGKAFLN